MNLIYIMISKTTECFYVGSTRNLQQRIQNHLSYFRKGKHTQRLQELYNAFGEEEFEWQVLETVPVGVKTEDYEKEVIQRYWGDPLLLNKTRSGSPGVRGKTLPRQTEEHRRKLGDTFRGKPKSEEQRAKMSESARLRWKHKKMIDDVAFCYGS
jgi:group I intron endonuclease